MGTAPIMLTFLVSCLLLVSYSFVEALSPISVKGTKLYDDDGNQFFVKGVSYIPPDGDYDPLLHVQQCRTDAALMSKAGVNTIYVYTADATQDHDACMRVFADQGIYVWLQLGDFPRVTNESEKPPEWTLSLFASWTEVLDTFAVYNNTLAFGIGQETINENSTSTRVAPALKAAARDLRAFRSARGYRAIPLAYSAADVAELRLLTAQYLTCDVTTDSTNHADNPTSIDLLGLNIFNPTSCTATAWSTLRSQLASLPLPIPVVISESGCLPASGGKRTFSDLNTVLLGGAAFEQVFSGANAFQWAEHQDNGFGLVKYGEDGDEGAEGGNGAPETLLPAYTALSSLYNEAKAKVTGTRAARYTPSGGAALACPTLDEDAGWLVDGKAALPTIEGLQIGTVTVKTTVTEGGSEATGGAGEGQGQGQVGGGDDGGGGGQLSTGAIAGITVGAVIGVLALVTGVLVCLRRRRNQAPNDEAEGIQVVENFKRPRSYWYPKGKVELPAQNMAAIEMDGSLRSAGSSAPVWKIPMQDGRVDSPTVMEVQETKWSQEPQYELEGHYMAPTGDDTQPGTWRVSPLSPGTKYV